MDVEMKAWKGEVAGGSHPSGLSGGVTFGAHNCDPPKPERNQKWEALKSTTR